MASTLPMVRRVSLAVSVIVGAAVAGCADGQNPGAMPTAATKNVSRLAEARQAAPPAAAEPGAEPAVRPASEAEAYDRIVERDFQRVASDALSTFSIDVDTASYANVRRFLSPICCRRRTPCGSRRCSTISGTRIGRRQPTARIRWPCTSRSTAARGIPSTGWRGSASLASRSTGTNVRRATSCS